ncbi:MAG: FAD-dependent oxidoreductase [Blautia sp.]|nr:FAD-dependent oxidoreductase [Blautia sp.]
MGKIAILGAGPAGISAAYHLKKAGIQATVYEKKDTYGGLCGGFTIDGFHFDNFAHLTFSKNPQVNALLEEQTPYLIHQPEAMNYYEGSWVRNPVQNNLCGLPVEDRISVITDYVNREEKTEPKNYGQWLRLAYGDYFAEHFPYRYTRKYWTVEPESLETEWVKGRMYVPSLEEILRGAFESDTPNVHYSKEMHYPKEGGFQGFLKPLIEGIDIEYKKEVVKLAPGEKRITFADGSEESYDHLITTLPLSLLPEMTEGLPDSVCRAAERLDYTSGYMISVGVNKEISFPTIWFYIYDESILPARVYFPNKKAPNNVPEGCSSLQAEVYVSRYRSFEGTKEELQEKVIELLIGMGLFEKEDIMVKDIRFEEFANIMFTPDIYEARKTVREYLERQGILCAGRFGEWDYLWLEQSLLSGKRAAEELSGRK